jgi:hypothetical protein
LYDFEPELDNDIVNTNEHMTAAEKQYAAAEKKGKAGKKPSSAARLQTGTDVRSDPICDSAGCSQYLHPKPPKEDEHPMDYFVPNFGRDPEVTNVW